MLHLSALEILISVSLYATNVTRLNHPRKTLYIVFVSQKCYRL